MTRLLHFVAISGLLLSAVGCCCGQRASYYPPAGGCPDGNCGIGAAAPGPGFGVAQQSFYNSYGTAQAVTPGTITTTNGPVALGPIIPGPVSYAVPTTTTTFLTTPLTTTAALQPLPTY